MRHGAGDATRTRGPLRIAYGIASRHSGSAQGNGDAHRPFAVR
jgi:hypothetical protein